MPHALVLSLSLLSAALVAPAAAGRLVPAHAADAGVTPVEAQPLGTVAPADSVRADRVIQETVLRHARDARRCYETEGLRRNPALAGTVELEVTVLPTGVVEHVAATPARFAGEGASQVAACLVALARHWRFERGPFQVEVIVFPFRFAPTEPAAAAFQATTD